MKTNENFLTTHKTLGSEMYMVNKIEIFVLKEMCCHGQRTLKTNLSHVGDINTTQSTESRITSYKVLRETP